MKKFPAVIRLIAIGLLSLPISAQSYWTANDQIVVAGQPIRIVETRPVTDVRNGEVYTETRLNWSTSLREIENVVVRWELSRSVYESTGTDVTVLSVVWMVSPSNYDIGSDYAGRTILRWDEESALHFVADNADTISVDPNISSIGRSRSNLTFSFDTNELIELFSDFVNVESDVSFVFGNNPNQSGFLPVDLLQLSARFLLRSEDEQFTPVSLLSSDEYSTDSGEYVPLITYNDELQTMVSEFSIVHRHHGEQWPLTWKFMVPEDDGQPVVRVERSFIGASGHISSLEFRVDEEYFRLNDIEPVSDYQSLGYVDMVRLSDDFINRLRSGARDIHYEITGRFSHVRGSFSPSEVQAILALLY